MGFPPEMIVVTVAAELRIRYQLERAYNIPRSTRFLRAKGPQFPQFTTAPDFAESSDVDIPPLLDTPGEGAPDAVPEELSRRATTPVVVQGNRPPQFVKVPPTTTSTEDAVTAQRPITIDDLSELTELDVEPDDDAEGRARADRGGAQGAAPVRQDARLRRPRHRGPGGRGAQPTATAPRRARSAPTTTRRSDGSRSSAW